MDLNIYAPRPEAATDMFGSTSVNDPFGVGVYPKQVRFNQHQLKNKEISVSNNHLGNRMFIF